MEKKYALYIIIREGYGGAERRLMRIYNKLAKEKTIDLIIRGTNRKHFDEISKRGDIEIKNFHLVKCFEMTKMDYIKCLLWFIKKSYTSIHFFDYSFSFILLSLLVKSKLICTVANYDYNKGQLADGFKKLLPRCNYIDLLYPDALDYINTIAKGKQILITPGSFTDLNIFYPKQKKNIIAFAAARLTASKNPMLLVKAAVLCKEELRRSEYKIVILGKGYLEEEIKDFIRENNIEDIVDMCGYVQTSEIIPYASVFTSLQLDSNYPSQSLIEGIACGCYIIATNTGDTSKMVSKSFSKLINKNDEHELSEAIIEYINFEHEKKKSCEFEARLFSETNFNIIKSLRYFNNILDLCY